MSSALHHLQMYRLKSKITYGAPRERAVMTNNESSTRFFGPHALPPTHEEVCNLLLELDHWNATAPLNLTSDCPQQSKECKREFYLQTMLLLMRPIMRQDSVDQDLLLLCAEKAAEGCEVCFSLIVVLCCPS